MVERLGGDIEEGDRALPVAVCEVADAVRFGVDIELDGAMLRVVEEIKQIAERDAEGEAVPELSHGICRLAGVVL